MIAVSYLKSKFSKEETIRNIDNSDADLIHVDLMDGLYVEEKNFTIEEVLNDLKNTTKPLDIHLMVKEPLNYLKDLLTLNNIWMITFHLDSTSNIEETIKFIKDNYIKVGIAVNPDESLDIIYPYINRIDYVLIMSVYPGKGGQKFIPDVIDKIKELQDKNIYIGIDGGINEETIKCLKDLRVDNIISGSYVCLSDDMNASINELKEK